MKKNALPPLGYLLLTSLICMNCSSSKQETETNSTDTLVVSDSTTVNPTEKPTAKVSFTGQYVYDAGSSENGYGYFKVDLKEEEGKIAGTFYYGYYLGKIEEGSYTNPSASIERNVSGYRSDATTAFVYINDIVDSSRIDNTYMFPDVGPLISSDAEGDDFIYFSQLGDNLISTDIHQDTVSWERVK